MHLHTPYVRIVRRDDCSCCVQLELLQAHDLFFYGGPCDHPVNIHNLLLSNSMSSVHSLGVTW